MPDERDPGSWGSYLCAFPEGEEGSEGEDGVKVKDEGEDDVSSEDTEDEKIKEADGPFRDERIPEDMVVVFRMSNATPVPEDDDLGKMNRDLFR